MDDVHTALMDVLLFAAEQALAQTVRPVKRPEIVRVALAVLVVPLCCLLPTSSFKMDAGYQKNGMPIKIIVGYLLPTAALMAGKMRR